MIPYISTWSASHSPDFSSSHSAPCLLRCSHDNVFEPLNTLREFSSQKCLHLAPPLTWIFLPGSYLIHSWFPNTSAQILQHQRGFPEHFDYTSKLSCPSSADFGRVSPPYLLHIFLYCSTETFADYLNVLLLLLLLLSRFSRVRLCATPEMAAHQAPLYLGFSRQEHQSGLPFPSPMHESEKWKWSLSVMSNS